MTSIESIKTILRLAEAAASAPLIGHEGAFARRAYRAAVDDPVAIADLCRAALAALETDERA